MASAWGLAWAEAWNGAWGAIDGGAAPPAPPAAPTVRPSGGYPSDRGPTKEQTRRSRVLHGLEKEIVERVAQRQAESLDLDDIQKQQELSGELKLRGIEARIEHYEALTLRRQALIDAEIAQRIRQIILDDEAALVLIIAASL